MNVTKPRTLLYTSLIAVAAILVGLGWPDLVGRFAYAVESGQAKAAREQLAMANDLSVAFQHVTKAITPSVVSVRSIKTVEMQRGPMRGLPGPFGDDFFERFFGNRMPRNPQGEDGGQQHVRRGLGTGVIVSDDGYILTNHHVVGGADSVTVSLSDDRTFDAEIVGTDEQTDLAVLQIDASGLMPAELGDSEALKVGEWVMAMGNPFGLPQTVTAGIISATGRANVGITDYEDFIQTDAAINPGNSGGPLVNLKGEVVGINTAIATRTGGYQGIGFAIPSNMARQIMDIIIREGEVSRGWLGVVIQDLTDDLAASFEYDSTDGVLVGDVPQNGPAAEAGIKPGDIIVRFNGKSVEDMNELRHMVALTTPGSEAEVEVVRDGERKTIAVEIGELEGNAVAAATGGQGVAEDVGMKLQTLTPEIAQQLNLDGDVSGVVVTNITPGGVAERAGLRVGDVITRVGRQAVSNVTDFNGAMRDYNLDKGVRLQVRTQGMQRFVFLKK